MLLNVDARKLMENRPKVKCYQGSPIGISTRPEGIPKQNRTQSISVLRRIEEDRDWNLILLHAETTFRFFVPQLTEAIKTCPIYSM